jgi:hypothetical protein
LLIVCFFFFVLCLLVFSFALYFLMDEFSSLIFYLEGFIKNTSSCVMTQ